MLLSLDVTHFRCISHAYIEFDARATALVGPNASGKTSLLEAAYFLAHGRSFRTAQRETLLQDAQSSLRVVARLGQQSEPAVVAGVEYSPCSLDLHLGGSPVRSFSDVAALLPVQVIDPGVHRIVEEGSARRRRLLDWGVFHVEHTFLPAWRRYQRALRQRNAALRAGQPREWVQAWDDELASAGETVDQHRSRYAQRLRPHFERWAGELVCAHVTVEYARGWAAGADLREALQRSFVRDARLKTTSVGAHRADLRLLVGEGPAKERVSRGQQKMLASALVLSQVALRGETSELPSCLLLDDPAAELDVDNLGKLFGALAQIPAQLVVTSVSRRGVGELPFGRMFHVEQGAVRPMV